MKSNLTEMIFILDRSGSMGHLTEDTIGGFNSMIESQKKEDGEAYVTTVLFDHEYKVLHDHVNIQDIKPMTNDDYYARGCTALLDAVGTTINSVGKRLSDTPEEERPEKIIVVITTDGAENASKEFTKDAVKAMIEHQQQKYSWMFIFLGANIDAIGEAQSLGIAASHSHTYTASDIGTASVYASVDSALCCARAYTDSLCSDDFDGLVSKALSSIV